MRVGQGDKRVDFLGVARVIVAVKETLMFLWDRIAFYSQAQARASIEVIAEVLPVLVQIAEAEHLGKIEPELAEKLRRKTIGACSKFVEAGVIIPEMSLQAAHSPRQLMTPERKLLAAPKGTSEVMQEDSPSLEEEREHFDAYAAIKALQEQLAETKAKQKPTRATSRKAAR